MPFLSPEALERMGFEELGAEVFVSEQASIHGASRIRLGSHVRIDDFCVLSAGSGGIEIGSYVHIAAYSSIIGAGRVSVGDFANISSRVAIYSSSDDYSGVSMTNPMVPDAYKSVDHRPVTIGRHVIVGSGSVVLPGVHLAEGVAIGALSLVRDSCEPFTIHAGVPASPRGERSRLLREAEKQFRATWEHGEHS
jgi:galactoside O-acetyltransferase